MQRIHCSGKSQLDVAFSEELHFQNFGFACDDISYSKCPGLINTTAELSPCRLKHLVRICYHTMLPRNNIGRRRAPFADLSLTVPTSYSRSTARHMSFQRNGALNCTRSEGEAIQPDNVAGRSQVASQRRESSFEAINWSDDRFNRADRDEDTAAAETLPVHLPLEHGAEDQPEEASATESLPFYDALEYGVMEDQACVRVFETFELMETILLMTDLSDMFRLRGMNSTFKGVIENSRPLRRKLFLNTDHSVPEGYWTAPRVGRNWSAPSTALLFSTSLDTVKNRRIVGRRFVINPLVCKNPPHSGYGAQDAARWSLGVYSSPPTVLLS